MEWNLLLVSKFLLLQTKAFEALPAWGPSLMKVEPKERLIWHSCHCSEQPQRPELGPQGEGDGWTLWLGELALVLCGLPGFPFSSLTFSLLLHSFLPPSFPPSATWVGAVLWEAVGPVGQPQCLLV